MPDELGDGHAPAGLAPAAGWTRRTVRIDPFDVILEAPDSPDDLVRDLAKRGDAERGYWAHLWSSSEVQSLLFALPDYLRPTDVSRLLANKALMAPTQTSCTVPREVIEAAPQSMYQFVAYGGESDFSYPPRPADPKVAWNIEWTVKVRYRSATGGMLGMENPYGAVMGGEEAGDRPASDSGRPPAKPKKPKGTDILRGLGVPIPGGL
jgi:hypothetical protein